MKCPACHAGGPVMGAVLGRLRERARPELRELRDDPLSYRCSRNTVALSPDSYTLAHLGHTGEAP